MLVCTCASILLDISGLARYAMGMVTRAQASARDLLGNREELEDRRQRAEDAWLEALVSRPAVSVDELLSDRERAVRVLRRKGEYRRFLTATPSFRWSL